VPAPEAIQTVELVWEQRVASDMMLTAALFNIDVDNVIRQDFEDGTAFGYKNAGELRSNGIELQCDYRRGNGIWSYINYSWQHATENGQRMPNSPEHLAKAGISTPTSRPLQGAIELLYGSARKTIGGAETANGLIANMNLTAAITKRLSLGVTIRNLFNTPYATPGGPEHLQDTIPQDGRTFVVRLIAKGR